MSAKLCEVCGAAMGSDDLEDGVSVPADCCERVGLCARCREPGAHDCDVHQAAAR